MLPGGLVRRVVGHLVLEHDRLAVLSVPDDLVLLVVLDEEACRGHVVAVDDDAGVGGVDRPADAVAVVRAPGPDVVEDDVVAVDLEADGGLADVRAADAEEHVVERGRVGRVAVVPVVAAVAAVPRPDLEQHRRVDGAGVEDQPGDLDAAHVGDGHRHDAVPRVERRHAESEHDRVGALHLDRAIDVVDTGREEKVLPAGERIVDRLDVVGGLGDEEPLDRDRVAGRLAAAPARARGVEPRVGDEDVVAPVRVDVEERLLARHGVCGRESCRAGSGTTAPGRRGRRRRPGSRRRCSSRRVRCSSPGTAAATR